MAAKTTKSQPKQPTKAGLAEQLGASMKHWDAIVAHLDRECPKLVKQWKHYGPKYGWNYKLADKRRALCYLIPKQKCFRAGIAMNDKAVAALQASDMPVDVIRDIVEGKRYPEGRAAEFDEVTKKKQVEIIKRLLNIKMAAS